MHNLVRSCLVSVLAVGLSAQATHLVGPGGYAEIDDALLVAAPGDIVHVQPGTYAPFTASIGVIIRGLGDVQVGDPAAAGRTLLAPPTGQQLHVADLTFREPVVVSSGRVSIDSCTLWTATNTPGDAVLSVTNASVHLQSSDCRNGFGTAGHAMQATNAAITAVDCLFLSAISTGPIGAPPTVNLDNAQLHASGSRFRQVVHPAGGMYSLRAQNGSVVWLSDCEMYASYGLTSMCGIDSIASSVRMSRTSLLDGGPCTGGAPGNTLLGVTRSAPLQPGANFSLEFRTDPSAFVLVLAGPTLGTVDLGSLVEQPKWLQHQSSFSAVLLLADGAGNASANWNLPGAPGITDLTLWFAGISGLSLPLQASPVVGGVAR